MAELKVRRSSSKKKIIVGGIRKLKIVLKKLQKIFLLRRNNRSSFYDDEERDDTTYVPDDVKEGHFAVMAGDGEEPKRFVVPLSCLNNPTFLKLLEQAEEEHGFDQDGALTIPCRPSELEMLLAQQWKKEGDYEGSGSSMSYY